MIDEQAAALHRLMNGYQVSQAIHVAATLNLADALADGPRSVSSLATTCNCHPEALYRLMRALAPVDVFEELPDRHFALAPLGEPLRSDAEPSLAGWARFNGRPYHWAAWTGLLHSMRTGENAFRAVHGIGAWDYREAHPEETAIFAGAMTSLTHYFGRAVLAAYDFEKFGTIADIGGSRGALVAQILQKHQATRGIVFDQAHVVAGAPELLAVAGVADRCEVVAGSFFEAVPAGADAYLLKDILHDWPDAECQSILRVCRAAMPVGTTILVIERLLGPQQHGRMVAFADLNMLTGPGGAERSSDEYEQMLAATGFQVTRTVPTRNEIALVEAVAVPM